MSKRIYPVPEIILDDHISIEGVEAGHGSMDNSARLMRVPLLDSPACRHVRAHEMAHARFSPDKPMCPERVHPMTIQRVEDMRMNVICRRQGLNDAMDAPIVTEPVMWDRLLTGDRENLTAGISTFGTGDWPEFVKRARPSEDDKEFIQSVSNALADDPSWRNTQRLSEAVEAYLRHEDPPMPPEPEPGEGEPGEGEPESQPGEGEPEGEPGEGKPSGEPGEGEPSGTPVDLTGDPMDAMVDDALENEARRADMSPFEKGLEALKECSTGAYGCEREARIVQPKVITQRLTKRLAPNKFKSRAKTPGDSGMVPRYMNRYCTDKAIFAARGRKRSQGGTILIDASSSMTISDHEVDKVMDQAPLGTIATYNAGYSDDGEIWVIAEKGKRAVGRLTPTGVCNKVDVPALEWMVTKREPPYYWVCDGYVSGASPRGGGEIFGKNVFARCMELVEKHGIIMVPSLNDLPDVMRETL